MDIHVLTRSGYDKIYWGERYAAGISDEAKSRGREVILHSSSELTSIPTKSRCIMLSSSKRWLHGILDGSEIRPLLLTPTYDSSISYVTFDYAQGIRGLVDRLRADGFNKTALVSCNADSLNDLAKKRAFVSLTGEEDAVYYHHSSIGLRIFDEFLRYVGKYDSVICTNDIVYLMLRKQLLAAGADTSGIAFATFSDRRFHLGEQVRCAVTDYYELGRAAVSSLCLLESGRVSQTLAVRLDCGFSGDEPAGGSARKVEPEPDEYLEDSALFAQQLKFLLGGADPTDIELLRLSLDGMSYEEISERLYMSVNALKRRMKSMLDSTGCKSKSEFIGLLKQYMTG